MISYYCKLKCALYQITEKCNLSGASCRTLLWITHIAHFTLVFLEKSQKLRIWSKNYWAKLLVCWGCSSLLNNMLSEPNFLKPDYAHVVTNPVSFILCEPLIPIDHKSKSRICSRANFMFDYWSCRWQGLRPKKFSFIGVTGNVTSGNMAGLETKETHF